MKKFSLWAVLTLVLGTAFFAVSCGGSSSDSDAETSYNAEYRSIDDLPSALSPVISEETAASVSRVAETGMVLGDTDESDFNASSSRAACETFNFAKSAIKEAAQGAAVQCYVGTVVAAATAGGIDMGFDVYDGEAHTMVLTNEEGSERPDLVQMKFGINDDGLITSFIMKSCHYDDEEVLGQDSYLRQTIDPETGTFTLINKGTYTSTSGEGTSEGTYQTDVTGTVNTEGYFVGTKTIVQQGTSTWTEGDNTNENTQIITMEQGETSGGLYGFQQGEGSWGAETFTYTNKAYSLFQILDGNTIDPSATVSDYSIGLLAIGDGASLFQSTNTYCAEGDDCSDEQSEAWLGDTTEPTDTNEYLATVQAYDLSTITPTTVSMTFEETSDEDTNEVIDCAAALATAEDTDIDFEALGVNPEEACDQVNHNWINCWEIIEGGE